MKYRLLSTTCDYRKDRISVNEINEHNYISTENMHPNRGGVEIASSVAEGKTFPAYKQGDILLSNIRPYFKKIWFANKKGGCSNDVLVLKPNKSVDSKFLYYVLSDNNFFNYSTVTSKGTKMPRGSKTAIMKYLVPDIEISTQKRIADILSAYDDLIENNNLRIALLEKAAQELYKEWFVRFRFPGCENVKFENGLPEGWERTTFEKIASFQNGYAFKSNELLDSAEPNTYEVFKQGHIKRGGGFKAEGTKSWYHKSLCTGLQKFVLHKKDVLMAMTDMKDNVAILGNTAIMPYDNRYILNQRVGLLRPTHYRETDFAYIHLLTNSYDFVQDLRSRANRGVQVNLSAVQIRESETVVPSEIINKKFAEIMDPIFEEIFNIMIQSENLAKQRDLLLPRLMSGKLDV